MSDALPIYTTYFIDVDPTWHTQKVEIETRVNGKYTRLRLATNVRLGSSDAGKWRVNNAPYPALDGCIDIDLGITPATNTLPIRRLGLHPGQSAEVVAAWVRFPALTVEPLPQRYTCLAPDRYRYESPNFTAELTVDPHGLVLDYEGLWRAIAHEEA